MGTKDEDAVKKKRAERFGIQWRQHVLNLAKLIYLHYIDNCIIKDILVLFWLILQREMLPCMCKILVCITVVFQAGMLSEIALSQDVFSHLYICIIFFQNYYVWVMSIFKYIVITKCCMLFIVQRGTSFTRKWFLKALWCYQFFCILRKKYRRSF